MNTVNSKLCSDFPDASCLLNTQFDNRPIRMKKIEELTDDEIARVRKQQAPCHFGNCTAKVRFLSNFEFYEVLPKLLILTLRNIRQSSGPM